jgi:hypothetical protein
MTMPSRVTRRRSVFCPAVVASRSRAMSAGIGPCPAICAGSGLSGSSSASTGTSTCTSTATSRPVACPVSRLSRGDLHGEAGGEVVHPPHPQPFDPFTSEPLVDGGPLAGVEVRGDCDDPLNGGFGQLPGGEQLPDVVEPEVQVPGQVQPAAPVERRHPAGHGHLGHDLPLHLLGLHVADRGQRCGPGERELPYRRRFPRGRDVLRYLRRSNGVEQLTLAGRQRLEHMFEYGVTITIWVAGEERSR